MKYRPVTSKIIETLQEIAGPRNVAAEVDKLQPYSHDEVTDSRYHHMPEVVVFPQTTSQVAAIVKLANDELIPVVPRGGGTGLACGAVPVCGGIVLSLEKMNKIVEINADSLYMIVEPGVRTEVVQLEAKAAGLYYAGDPCSGDSSFIGGNVATNAGGNRAVRYGTTRDQVYAVEVVTPTGKVTTLGGRLEKASTGYSLEQLIIGSEGTLGIITKIMLRLMPLPQHSMDLLAVFPDINSAIGAVGKILKAGLNPTCVEYLDNVTIKSIERYLNEKLPVSEKGNYIIIELEGDDPDELDEKAMRLDDLCDKGGVLDLLLAEKHTIWKARKAFAEAVRHESLIMSKEDIVVPVDQIPAIMAAIFRLSEKYRLVARTASHAGDGNIHLNILKGDLPEDEWDDKLTAFQHELYEAVYKLGGKLSGEHGIGYKRKGLMAEFCDPVELEMMRAIKRALDPNNIMNPGKIFDV